MDGIEATGRLMACPMDIRVEVAMHEPEVFQLLLLVDNAFYRHIQQYTCLYDQLVRRHLVTRTWHQSAQLGYRKSTATITTTTTFMYRLHSIDDQPAYVVTYLDGSSTTRKWYRHGRLHRGWTKPAHTCTNRAGKITYWAYMILGQKVEQRPTEDMPWPKVRYISWLIHYG